MELIRIGDSKLKISLTSDDMSAYALDSDTMDYDNKETRRAFWDILDRAKHVTGFDAAGDRVFVQLYPGKKGGCEMYVTKLSLVCADRREREHPDPALPATRAGRAHAPSPAPRPLLRGGEEHDRLGAWRFERMGDLLAVCRRLSLLGYTQDSSAYRDERDRYFLLLYQGQTPYGLPCGICAFLTEFGTPENAETVRLYISEHGSPICEGNAVGVLSRF